MSKTLKTTFTTSLSAVFALAVCIYALHVGAAELTKPDFAPFDIRGILRVADLRIEPVFNPPTDQREQVGVLINGLKSEWLKRRQDCRAVDRAYNGQIKVKAYLNKILSVLTEKSFIKGRLESEFGVCIQPVAESAHGARMQYGVIEIPGRFLLAAKSEAEVAFLIAHELSHFLLHHELLRTYLDQTDRRADPEQAQDQIFYGFVEMKEREADELAMALMINAGYKLEESLDLWMRIRGENSGGHLSAYELKLLMDSMQLRFQRQAVKLPDWNGRLTPYQPVRRHSADVPSEVEDEAKQSLKNDKRDWYFYQKWLIRLGLQPL